MQEQVMQEKIVRLLLSGKTKKVIQYDNPNDELFNTKYAQAQSLTPFSADIDNTQMTLCAIYDTIIENIKMVNEPKSISSSGPPGGTAIFLGYRGIFNQTRATWLFYKINTKTITDKLADFIISKHDQYLTPGDYTLLFYISLQEPETQESLHGLPMSMLYDIYEPFVENAKNEWRNRDSSL
jgi:hypothetical protein